MDTEDEQDLLELSDDELEGEEGGHEAVEGTSARVVSRVSTSARTHPPSFKRFKRANIGDGSIVASPFPDSHTVANRHIQAGFGDSLHLTFSHEDSHPGTQFLSGPPKISLTDGPPNYLAGIFEASQVGDQRSFLPHLNDSNTFVLSSQGNITDQTGTILNNNAAAKTQIPSLSVATHVDQPSLSDLPVVFADSSSLEPHDGWRNDFFPNFQQSSPGLSLPHEAQAELSNELESRTSDVNDQQRLGETDSDASLVVEHPNISHGEVIPLFHSQEERVRVSGIKQPSSKHSVPFDGDTLPPLGSDTETHTSTLPQHTDLPPLPPLSGHQTSNELSQQVEPADENLQVGLKRSQDVPSSISAPEVSSARLPRAAFETIAPLRPAQGLGRLRTTPTSSDETGIRKRIPRKVPAAHKQNVVMMNEATRVIAQGLEGTHISQPTQQPIPQPLFVCNQAECRAPFSTYEELKAHILQHHKQDRKFKCTHDGCDAAFTERGNLAQHQRIHTGTKPYKCTFEGCTMAFAQKGNLNAHVRTHTGERPFKCTHSGCAAAFVTSGELTVHVYTHTGEKPYWCMYAGCGAAFTQAGSLTRHMRIHTNEKPFKCTAEGCDAAFIESSNLVKHMRRHTGEKPYLCQVEGCNAHFSRIDQLSRHQRKHKPLTATFQCPHCSLWLPTSQSLANHILIHTTEPIAERHDLPGATPHTGMEGGHFDGGGLSEDLHVESGGVVGVLSEHVHPGTNNGAVPPSALALVTEAQENHFSLRAPPARVRNYACDFEGCTLRFTTPSSLSNHRRRHPDGPIRCPHPDCLSLFNDRASLDKHFREHVRQNEDVLAPLIAAEDPPTQPPPRKTQTSRTQGYTNQSKKHFQLPALPPITTPATKTFTGHHLDTLPALPQAPYPPSEHNGGAYDHPDQVLDLDSVVHRQASNEHPPQVANSRTSGIRQAANTHDGGLPPLGEIEYGVGVDGPHASEIWVGYDANYEHVGRGAIVVMGREDVGELGEDGLSGRHVDGGVEGSLEGEDEIVIEVNDYNEQPSLPKL